MSRGVQAIGAVAALMVLLAIIWSLIQGDPDPSASWVQQNKWFVVTIVDVYAGLGLAIVDTTARRMGARVQFANRSPQGLEVVLWLPLAKDEQDVTGAFAADVNQGEST